MPRGRRAGGMKNNSQVGYGSEGTYSDGGRVYHPPKPTSVRDAIVNRGSQLERALKGSFEGGSTAPNPGYTVVVPQDDKQIKQKTGR